MDARSVAQRIVENVERVIVGKRAQVELAVMTLMCGGHLLIEDVPGVGKTMLARSLARSSGCSFSRIQFTPDLLPTDVTGVSMYNQSTRDGVTHHTPAPFMVMGTQNPIEYEGTFPLPEAQLDRFLLRLELGYPSVRDEKTIMERQRDGHPVAELEQVCESNEILSLQEAVRDIYIDVLVQEYIVSLMNATRNHDSVYLGASPRGSLALQRLGQAQAILDGRDFVLPDDVKALAYPALGHRIILNAQARVKGATVQQVLAEALQRLPVPGVRASERASRRA